MRDRTPANLPPCMRQRLDGGLTEIKAASEARRPPRGLDDMMEAAKKKGASMEGTSTNKVSHTERIVRDPQICGGEPVFRGTRVTLRTVLASLADGDSIEEILVDFPSLTKEDIQAAIAFAAASAEEDLPVPPVPRI